MMAMMAISVAGGLAARQGQASHPRGPQGRLSAREMGRQSFLGP